MAKKNPHNKTKLPGWTPIRDPLIVALILGATKSGVHKDRKKEANKKACRGKTDHQ